MSNRRSFMATTAAALVLGAAVPVRAQPLTLKGASHLNDEHVYTRALRRFFELLNQYNGEPIASVVHRNAELGSDKDYFTYMNQGISVDCAIVSPAHMSTFSRAAFPYPRS